MWCHTSIIIALRGRDKRIKSLRPLGHRVQRRLSKLHEKQSLKKKKIEGCEVKLHMVT